MNWPNDELFDMLFLFFERTENERTHQGKIGCAVDGTGSDAASAWNAAYIFPIKETWNGPDDGTDEV